MVNCKAILRSASSCYGYISEDDPIDKLINTIFAADLKVCRKPLHEEKVISNMTFFLSIYLSSKILQLSSPLITKLNFPILDD